MFYSQFNTVKKKTVYYEQNKTIVKKAHTEKEKF